MRTLMRDGAFKFAGNWLPTVRALGETGMGYVVVRVALRDGRTYPQVLIDSGHLSRVRGLPNIPFAEDDIAEIKQTDAKWDWDETP
jgi:hypothetical protein